MQQQWDDWRPKPLTLWQESSCTDVMHWKAIKLHQARYVFLTSLQVPSWALHIRLTSVKVPKSTECLLKSAIVPQSTSYLLISHKVRHRNDYSFKSLKSAIEFELVIWEYPSPGLFLTVNFSHIGFHRFCTNRCFFCLIVMVLSVWNEL